MLWLELDLKQNRDAQNFPAHLFIKKRRELSGRWFRDLSLMIMK